MLKDTFHYFGSMASEFADQEISDDILKEKDFQSRPPMFRLTDELLSESDSMDAVISTYNDMYSLGLNKHPYHYYTIEISVLFCSRFAKLVAPSVFDKLEKMVTDKLTPEAARNRTITIIVMTRKNLEHPDQMGFSMILNDMDVTKILQKQLEKGRSIDVVKATTQDIQTIAFYLTCFLRVILVTKNVEKETVVNSTRSLSPRKRREAKRYVTTTTISIGKITESYGDPTGTGSAKRPHFRRGHIRHQRVGPGRTETKQVFIQPMFVNADEKWINEQKNYRVIP